MVILVTVGASAAIVAALGHAKTPRTNCEEAEARTKKVLFVGIDGVRSDALKAARALNLQALIRHGAYAGETRILGPRFRGNDTVSAPGWASILTGVWADKHGVLERQIDRTHFDVYPDFLHRLKRARPGAKTAVFASWERIFDHMVRAPDVPQLVRPRDGSVASALEADRRVAEAAARHLARAEPDAVFVYFILPDTVGHAAGFHPRIPAYRQAIEAVDGFLGIVLRAMRERTGYAEEDWLVIVTSDHGGTETGHFRGHDDPAVVNVPTIIHGAAARRGSIPAPTYIVDVPVTALAHLGIPIDPNWNLDGRVIGLRDDRC